MGIAFYKELTKPKDEWVSELRDLVIAKKLPRKIFVQPNTFLVGEKGEEVVELRGYEVSTTGVVQSFVERGV